MREWHTIKEREKLQRQHKGRSLLSAVNRRRVHLHKDDLVETSDFMAQAALTLRARLQINWILPRCEVCK